MNTLDEISTPALILDLEVSHDEPEKGTKPEISRIDWNNNEQKSVSWNLVLVVPYGLTTYSTGRGCCARGGNKPLALDRFIERANKVHKGRYGYSSVEFTNVESKIEIS